MASEDSAGSGRLTAIEVAEVLGVKRETVYAYVSRGILHRVLAMDGRTSLFDRAEVEELRRGRRPDRDGEMRTVLATRLTRVSDKGLWIRGHDLIDMVGRGAGFSDVTDLLWRSPEDDRWPQPAERVTVNQLAGNQLTADQSVADMAQWAHAPLLDQLRILVAAESAADPLRGDLSDRSVRAAGRRALSAMVSGLTVAGISTSTPWPADGDVDGAGDGDKPDLAALLWPRLTSNQSSPSQLRALDMALALLADHGLAASTFAARVAASVRADPYSVIGAGLGALGGPLHGAASMAVHRLYASAGAAGGDPAPVIGEMLQPDRPLPGFGHSVYRSQDPRYSALMAQIVTGWSDDPRLRTVFRVRDIVAERSDALANIDLALGALTYLGDMPVDAGEAIFAVARTAGWLAHAMEEYTERPLRFRPKASYLGDEPQ